jgi:hypothetical protein
MLVGPDISDRWKCFADRGIHRHRNLSYLIVNRLTLRLVDISEKNHVSYLPSVRSRLLLHLMNCA